MERSRISNTEWGLVIGALAIVDIVQVLLNSVVIGVIANRGISFILGMVLPFYLHIRGEKMGDIKRLLGLFGTFGVEFIPGFDLLPLWTVNGIYNMVLAKRRDKEATKQEKVKMEMDKMRKIEMQADRADKIQAIRQQQDAQREEQRIANQDE